MPANPLHISNLNLAGEDAVVALDGEADEIALDDDIDLEKEPDIPRAKCQAHNPLNDASIIQIITFGWMNGIMKLGTFRVCFVCWFVCFLGFRFSIICFALLCFVVRASVSLIL
jgi:hypothetical protein